MAFKPNFTDVRLKSGKVSAAGQSNKEDLDDIVGIQIFVTQDAQNGGESAKIATGFVPQSGESWRAEFDANGITVETHKQPMTTISWVQPVKIKKG
jgi:hypothetical protein